LYGGLGFEAARRYHLFAWDLRDEQPDFALDEAIEVRRAGLADLDALANVYAPVDLADSYWSRPPEEMEDLRHLAFWADLNPRPSEAEPDRVTLVAEMRGRVVGAVSVRHDRQLNEASGRRDGYLHRGGIAVLPSFRPREVGRSLLYAALDALRALGLQRALVWAYAPLTGNTPLVELYQDCGGRELRHLKAWDLECQP
jgi:GNAT superfamily N-acetyltransferase